MQWFQNKEKSAGDKRLALTWYIYLFLGKRAVYILAFFVGIFTYICSKDLRYNTKNYFETISKYTNLKPSVLNQIKLVVSYALSLVDKMIMYAGRFNTDNISFEDINEKEILFNDIKKNKGVCFIFSHTGNIELLQAFFQQQQNFPNIGINVFLNKNQTKTFNNFIEKIKKPIPVKYIETENFDISEMLKLKEKLDLGEVVFIAGDRISENTSSKYIEKIMFDKKVKLPKGTFRLAQLLEVPVYFIAALKNKNTKYKIYVKKLDTNNLCENYVKFLEQIIKQNPYQFYQFYDFFETKTSI